ncbi:hypothetical protein DSO57_1004602 [Entomophthora muscae]|uniref:Uncharacterized protein n=1 Tax=Entomophthora muscae TaxID=34485 RepID=A0ACC2TVR5_9FUNG|nr:hypothetical protein DSO57_1004602 [Entomophthora muscae]
MGIEALINGVIPEENHADIEETGLATDTQSAYQHTEITRVIRKAILTYMKGAKYQHSKVKEWQQQLSDHCLQKLTILKPPFPADAVKYIVSSTILQKGVSGFQSATSCFWDSELDRLITYTHEDEEFHVVVNIFAIVI